MKSHKNYYEGQQFKLSFSCFIHSVRNASFMVADISTTLNTGLRHAWMVDIAFLPRDNYGIDLKQFKMHPSRRKRPFFT